MARHPNTYRAERRIAARELRRSYRQWVCYLDPRAVELIHRLNAPCMSISDVMSLFTGLRVEPMASKFDWHRI